MPGLLRGADRAAFATAFGVRLRAHGVAVGQTAVEDFVRALAACPPDSRSRLYWTARTTLVRRHEERAAFDAVFRAVFENATLDLDDRGQAGNGALPPERPDDALRPVAASSAGVADRGGLPWATLPRVTGAAADVAEPAAVVVPQRLPSALAGLPDAPFAALDAAEMALLGAWLRAALPSWPTRRTRRQVADHAGHRVAVRPTIARARRTGWEAVTLVRTRPARRPRRVVLLCDVSRSMQPQATAYLHLMRALATGVDAEVFAFATRLTRLTPVLTHRSPAEAVAQATEKVEDRFGGTRIASSLRALLASHHADSTRGAVVVIASDGWDSDPPAALGAALARLRRRAYRLVWLNPRAGAPGFAPAVGSMAAALPYCDDFLPAGTFRSLADAIAVVGRHR